MNTLAPSFLYESSSILQVTRICMKAWICSNIGQIPPPSPELSSLGRLKKSMYNVVNPLVPLFLIGSSSYLQVMRTFITSRGRTGLVVRASDSRSEDPGSILGRVGVLFP